MTKTGIRGGVELLPMQSPDSVHSSFSPPASSSLLHHRSLPSTPPDRRLFGVHVLSRKATHIGRIFVTQIDNDFLFLCLGGSRASPAPWKTAATVSWNPEDHQDLGKPGDDLQPDLPGKVEKKGGEEMETNKNEKQLTFIHQFNSIQDGVFCYRL